MKILFICSSNICRSPYCEFVFRRMVEDDDVTRGKVEVSSASVVNRCKKIFPKARIALRDEGFSDAQIDAFSPCFKTNCKRRFEEADIIIGMSKAHRAFTPKKYRSKYASLSEVATGVYFPVPDPYMARSQESYNAAMDKIKSYLTQYFVKLKRELSQFSPTN